MRLLIILSLLIAPSVSHAITYDPSLKDKQVLDFGKKHECVVVIKCLLNEKPLMYSLGSGVLIAEDVVLTAAHVVHQGTKHEVICNGKHYAVSASVIHSKFSAKRFGYGDIAVVFLKEKIKQDFYPALYTKQDEIGKVCSIAGWGRHGNFKDGHGKDCDGLRRAGSNIVDRVDREMLMCSPSKDGDGSRMTTLECLVSPGDSGGGMFIAGKLAGLHSILTTTHEKGKGYTLNGGYTNVCGSTRVSIYVDWINDTIEKCRGHFRLIDQATKAIEDLKKLRD